MKTIFRKACLALILSLAFSNAFSQANDYPSDPVNPADLEKRIIQLERRVRALEKLILEERMKRNEKDTSIEALRNKAKERMRIDHQKFPPHLVDSIEVLYQQASEDITSKESQKILRMIVADFPKMNRAGCALLYLIQNEESTVKIKMLQQAINDFGDCMYLDGVEVGAYARYQLAKLYKFKNDVSRAKELMNEVRLKYPTAIDHEGNKLILDLHD